MDLMLISSSAGEVVANLRKLVGFSKPRDVVSSVGVRRALAVEIMSDMFFSEI